MFMNREESLTQNVSKIFFKWSILAWGVKVGAAINTALGTTRVSAQGPARVHGMGLSSARWSAEPPPSCPQDTWPATSLGLLLASRSPACLPLREGSAGNPCDWRRGRAIGRKVEIKKDWFSSKEKPWKSERGEDADVGKD